MQWEMCDKMAITTEKDKAYFKNLTNLSNNMQAKLEGDTGTLIDQELSNELRVTIQHVSLVVSSTKAYKQWAKKPDDVAYLAERARLDDFADQRPEISFCGSRLHLLGEIENSFACRDGQGPHGRQFPGHGGAVAQYQP